MKSVLVAGTASGVGKHTVCCALHMTMRSRGVRAIPFKPITIEGFPPRAGRRVTPSVYIQALAAGVAPSRFMNPIRVLLPASRRRRSLIFESGMYMGPFVASEASHERQAGVIEHAIRSLDVGDAFLIAEGSGALSDWAHSDTARWLVNRLDSRIVLVGNAREGGAIAGLVGTLEMVPLEWLPRVRLAVLNELDQRGFDATVDAWEKLLRDRYNVAHLAVLPHVPNIEAISEDQWPVTTQAKVRKGLEALYGSWGRVFDSVADALLV